MKKGIYLLLLLAMGSSIVACATPDSVKLNEDRVQRLQRQIDDLKGRIDEIEKKK